MIFAANNMGQTGNQLVLFAHCLATAIQTKQSLWFFFGADIRKTTGLREKRVDGIKVRCFGFSCRKLVSRIVCVLNFVFRENPFSFSKRKRYVESMPIRLRHFAEHPNRINPVFFWDFSNTPELIRLRQSIVQCLDFLPEFKLRPESWIADIRASHEIVVGVHLRKGDYKKFHGGKFYFSDDKYGKFMKSFSDSVSGSIAFVLVSNESIRLDSFPPEAIGGTAFVMKGNNPQEDMYLLSLCDYVMGPPSTFSWWSAYSGDRPYLVIRDSNNTCHLHQFSKVCGGEYFVQNWEKTV